MIAQLTNVMRSTEPNRYVKMKCEELMKKVNEGKELTGDEKFYLNFICKKFKQILEL